MNLMNLFDFNECDESDVGLWANDHCAECFFGAAEKARLKALSHLVDAKCKNRDESAAIVRAWDDVLDLFYKAREMK